MPTIYKNSNSVTVPEDAVADYLKLGWSRTPTIAKPRRKAPRKPRSSKPKEAEKPPAGD